MNHSFWNRKIPTLMGIILITLGVLATSYLVRIGIIYLSGAAPSDNPQNVTVSNITDHSVSITYTTETPVIGTVSLGESQNSLQTVLDDRDQQSGVPKEYVVHSITAQNLKPNTQYVFSITSGSTTYLHNGSLFTTKTAPTISAKPSSQTPLSGQVMGIDGKAPQEALIFVSTTGGQTLSTLVKSNGMFIIPLNFFRTTDLTQILALSPTTSFQIFATDGTNTTTAMVPLGNTNPVPLMTLGNTYNFTASTKPIATQSASIGFPSFLTETAQQATPEIITPQKNETFSDQQPQFNGKALPNQSVTITIHSSAGITTTVTSNAQGVWTYRPTSPLAPGQHTISITTKNAAGILQTIEQSFTVYASGSQVTQSATPSATLTPTSQPTLAATPTPTTVPTLSPTAIPTVQTTITPVPTKAQLPPTGSNALSTVATVGLVTTGIGIVLYVVSLGVL